MKKIISIMLSAFLLINTFAILPVGGITAQAADYAATLRNKGFPESYIEPLVELHKKYPNWIFEPFNTGLDWNTAVKGERSTHSKQLIEKYSGNDSSMYCNCAKCYKNGNYVIQEASNWVSASQKAVEYYMDPRNFLNEKHIFQFESTEYNGTQSQEGVEAILNGTWMHDSVISYKNTSGKTVSFKSKKYSDAIMEASNDSGLSAYYIASKIRQEVGGATPTAGGASGTNKTYPGIYNYYNIGAYTGAVDGLKWASTSLTGYYTNCDCRVREKATTNSSILVDLPKDTKVTYKSTTAKQSDGYTWYNISVTYGSKTYTGYIRSDLVDNRKTDLYSRPWISPYQTIYYGAKYIAANYKYQPTGYLQKFNVNKASGELYSHEYMANVAAASAESATTFNAYKNAGIIGITKTFSIPVFNNMPDNASKAGKWIKSNGKWWYRHTDGTYTKNDWELIDSKWYHFDKDGWMQTGWLKVGVKWYYLNSDGAMQTGWKKVGGTWYYMNSSGAMQTGWQKIKNIWYYMNSSGAMQTGWQKISNAWYYLDDSGAMLTGWQKIGGAWYYMNSAGRMQHDCWIGNYYVNSSGKWVKSR